MKNKFFIFLFFLSALTLAGACTKIGNTPQNSATTQSAHEDPDGYWTCSMHPQIHQHEKGKCPICGMDLIHISGKKIIETKSQNVNENENELQITQQQLNMVGIGRYTVLRKNFKVSIAVSGNLLTSGEIAIPIYESDLALVTLGSDFSGTTNSAPQEILKGKIKRIDMMMDPTTRTLRVFGTLSQHPKKMIGDGEFHGEITTQLMNQLVIPEEAVLHTGLRDLVYMISTDNKITPRAVTLGNKSMGEFQVLTGLSEGDVISSGPNFLLDSESKIRGAQ